MALAFSVGAAGASRQPPVHAAGLPQTLPAKAAASAPQSSAVPRLAAAAAVAALVRSKWGKVCRHANPTASAAQVPVQPAWKGTPPRQSSLPFRPDGRINYESIDQSPVSQVLMGTVRHLLAKSAGHDSPTPGYDGVMELVREVNDMEGTAQELQVRARKVFEGILPNLFIGWIPPLWKKYFQPNAPQWLSNYSFFLVFYLLFPWLMGPMEGDDHVDVEVPQSWRSVLPFLPESVRVPQTVKAERCRFLESANCASVCVNTCKVPSQGWLTDDFGMKLHIQPNYDDFSCRWKFGVEAPPLEEDEAVMVPCFTTCPSEYKGTKDALSMRQKLRADAEAAELEASNDHGMKPEVDLERKGLSDYGTTKLPKSKSGWASEELFLLTGLVCIIFSTIASTYYYWALLPAWEADESLGWTKSTTTLISWSSTVAEAVGLLVAGPLSDYIEPLQLILFETCLALIGVFVSSQIVTTAEGLVLNVFIIAFFKGILWPAVGATVFKMCFSMKIPGQRSSTGPAGTFRNAQFGGYS
ncbi:Beta-carotene isomerase D27, chloroplastic [Symbiodinium microadriaticum]|uniref:Beta-carotene isomerase D27, chloroplastic n=1 Tax=Symbiodinium microadriaticum TaxID=2951 RepID=A0A1Q9CT54_SYMMI|nr:Beta-carotene isomerase D27, chloroplastic [Symbiodinium microadriaticum]